MKNLFTVIALIVLFSSCGKKYEYKCTIIYGANVGNKTETVFLSMTERGARRYEKENSSNNDGVEYIILDNEVQCSCSK